VYIFFFLGISFFPPQVPLYLGERGFGRRFFGIGLRNNEGNDDDTLVFFFSSSAPIIKRVFCPWFRTRSRTKRKWLKKKVQFIFILLRRGMHMCVSTSLKGREKESKKIRGN